MFDDPATLLRTRFAVRTLICGCAGGRAAAATPWCFIPLTENNATTATGWRVAAAAVLFCAAERKSGESRRPPSPAPPDSSVALPHSSLPLTTTTTVTTHARLRVLVTTDYRNDSIHTSSKLCAIAVRTSLVFLTRIVKRCCDAAILGEVRRENCLLTINRLPLGTCLNRFFFSRIVHSCTYQNASAETRFPRKPSRPTFKLQTRKRRRNQFYRATRFLTDFMTRRPALPRTASSK